jgi:hypothetical protein
MFGFQTGFSLDPQGRRRSGQIYVDAHPNVHKLSMILYVPVATHGHTTIEHYEQTKYPLAVKLGAITANLEEANNCISKLQFITFLFLLFRNSWIWNSLSVLRNKLVSCFLF